MHSRENIWKLFDAISPTYDRINRILSLGLDQRWRRKVARYLPPIANLKILDLATGTGDQALALYNSKASIASLVGIDLSKEMLHLANKKVPCMQTLHADAEKIPFPSGQFDAISFSFGIRNVVSPLESMKEMHRVLKTKGRCLILEFSMPPQPIRFFFLFYLRYIMPYLGAFLSKDKKAYRYLNQTIETFPSGKDFCLLLKKAGFSRIRIIPMALGGVSLYIGEKL